MYLERREPEHNLARAYAVRVEPTLFGEWALVRQWGQINGAGGGLEDWFASRCEAEQAGERLIAAKRRRGYLIRP
jgi:predicted DNA-binding WGR domain protein